VNIFLSAPRKRNPFQGSSGLAMSAEWEGCQKGAIAVPGETFLAFLLCRLEFLETFDRLRCEGLVEGFKVGCKAIVFDSELAGFADPAAHDDWVFLEYGGELSGFLTPSFDGSGFHYHSGEDQAYPEPGAIQ
jgi:hypothetical protein